MAPRLTVQNILTPLRLLVSDPKLVAPLLVAILYYPEKLRSIIPARLFRYITSPGFVRTLKIILGLGIAGSLNSQLSRYQLNNGKGAAKFVKSQELVLISGGSSGIGKMMAEDFAKLGVKVIVVDLNPPKEAFASGIAFYKLDVTSTSEITEVAAEIRESHGEPTVLINNAGIGTCRTILGGTEDTTRKTFEVNTLSHFWMVREFLPAMIKKNHGHVVTIASLASYVVHASNVDYCCSKASALTFHEGLAVELRHRYNAPNIKTTVVHPAWVRTALTDPLTANPDFKDPVLEPEVITNAVVKQVLSGRSAQLILPAKLTFLSTIRAWPSWLQERLKNEIANVLKFNENIPLPTSFK